MLWNNIPQHLKLQHVSKETRSTIVLEGALRTLRPLVRLLLRNGIAYPTFVSALKRVFLDAARDELSASHSKVSDSALCLLSGIHRRDIRTLSVSKSPDASSAEPKSPNMVGQIVARWLAHPDYSNQQGHPSVLLKSSKNEPSFDQLVAEISTDIRPRAVLDELIRLGAAMELDGKITLLSKGFAPRNDLGDMVQQMQANVHDHLAAACKNITDQSNFLEQSLYVDEVTTESVEVLHAVAAKAWQKAFQTMMLEAQSRYDLDAANATHKERGRRVRFGCYFYEDAQDNV